jgi:hypothetical protein
VAGRFHIDREHPDYKQGSGFRDMEKSEITREAMELVREFGNEATLLAEARAKRAVSKQDAAKFHFWNRVADTVKDLERRNKSPMVAGVTEEA